MDTTLKKRTFAFFLDFTAITFLFKSLLYLYKSFLWEITETSLQMQREMMADMYLLEFPVFTIVFCSYFALSYFMSEGKTLGKIIFGLQISTNNQKRLELKHCLLRSIGYYFCYLPMAVLFIIPFIRSDQRGIPDWLSGTSVSLNKKQDKKTTIEETDIKDAEHLSSTG